MGKRGAGLGYLKPTMSKNADIFAKRGNPWNGEGRQTPAQPREENAFTQAIDEALRKNGFGSRGYAAEIRERFRTPDDPDFDQFSCKKAQARELFKDPPVKKKAAAGDYLTRVANARLRNKYKGVELIVKK
jgi:hypothetical protein